MPRAFLITHRRYNGAEEFEDPGRNYSPERAVRIPDYNRGHPTSDGGSECGSETSSECPEELYNLTKLAEVSLAAAAGTLIHPSNVLYQRPISPQCSDFRSGKASHPSEDDESLRSRTKLFFERIESEREAIESHSSGRSPEFLESRETSTGEISPLPHSFHRFHHRYHHHHHLHPHHPHQSLPPGDESKGGFPLRSFSAELKVPPVVPTPVAPARRSQSDKSEDNEDHECPDCGKKYSTSSNLARHRQTHRSLGDKKARRCPHCDKVYVSMPAFSMHVRTHNQGCKCHYCGKCFSRPWLLQGHIRTHTGEKPFKCTICNKAFADKSNLRAHIQTHSNTKPHVCGRCGKAFALKSYLYKHEESSCMRAHHRTSSSGSSSASASTEKCDTSSLQPAKSVVSPMARLPAATASPTSVIVPRLAALNREERSPGSSSSAFSAIIRHTKSSVVRSPSPKRRCLERRESGEDEKEDAEELVDENREKKEYLSSMVIRTSVISPNPEHLTRIGFAANAKKAFDFSDPSRSSAFSRPTGMTLNLAIA